MHGARTSRWQVRITIDAGRERDRLVDHARDLGGARGAAAIPPPRAKPTPRIGAVAAIRLVTASHGSIAADADAIAHFDGTDRARAMLDVAAARDGREGCVRPAPALRRAAHPAPARRDASARRAARSSRSGSTRCSARSCPSAIAREYPDSNDTDYAYELEGRRALPRQRAARTAAGRPRCSAQIPATVVTVEQMGISPEVQKLCQLNKGLVLVTGPTGSGKSTTLCSLIDLVNRSRSDHVITIEDPIEFVHPNKRCIITQRQVGVHTGSFKSALRAALREDPDIILVGELRDLETVSIAIETAETGHLVFGTLHTTTAAGTIDRIIDQFPADRQAQIRVMLAESLKGVISQTLCKKIGGGRVAAREVLLSITAVTNLIREGKTFQIPTVMQTSKRLGMVTLNDALLELVDGGLIEPREGYSKAVDKTMFLGALKARGLDTASPSSEAGAKDAPKAATAERAARSGSRRRGAGDGYPPNTNGTPPGVPFPF